MGDVEDGFDLDGEAAVEDGDGGKGDVSAKDDGAGSLVEDDFCGGLEADGEVLDAGDEFRDGCETGGQDVDVDASAVEGGCDGVTELLVDSVGDVVRGREVKGAEEKGDGLETVEVDADVALDDSAFGDAADGGVIDGLNVSGEAGGVAAEGERALCFGVDLAVVAVEGGHQEDTAFEAFGVADRGDGDVDLHAALGEGGQRGGDKDGGYVFDDDGALRDLDAEALEGIGEGLDGEEGLLAIAAAAKADDEAVADELVVADTLDFGDVAEADLTVAGGGEQGCGQREQDGGEREETLAAVVRTGFGCGWHLESEEPEDGSGERVGWADAVRDDALAFHFDLEIAEQGGGNDVVWADVAGAGDAADDDVFVLVVEEDLALGFDDEVAVGKDGDDLAGEAGGEGGVGGGLTLAFEGGVGVGAEERIDAVGGDAAGEAGDG